MMPMMLLRPEGEGGEGVGGERQRLDPQDPWAEEGLVATPCWDGYGFILVAALSFKYLILNG